MDRFISVPSVHADATATMAARKFMHLIVGHQSDNFLNESCFIARHKVFDRNGEIVWLHRENKIQKSYQMDDEQLRDEVVSYWQSTQVVLANMDSKQRAVVNSLKALANANTDWNILLVYHDKQSGKSDLDKYCYGNHVHAILHTKKQVMSDDPMYKKLRRAVTAISGWCKLAPIYGDVISAASYLANDEEKTFLGANSQELLDLYIQASKLKKTNPWNLGEDDEYQLPQRKRNIQGVTDSPPTADTTVSLLGPSAAKIPKHISGDKTIDTVKYIGTLLEKYKQVRTLKQLLVELDPDSEEFRAVCNVCTTSQGKEAFNIAMTRREAQLEQQSPADLIRSLPDNIKGHLTPRQSQAFFNAWCLEQNTKPKYLGGIYRTRLSGLGHKKIGIHMCGEPNSGKTVLTNTIFDPVREIVGKVTKSDNFAFMDCVGKRVVVGEEVAITAANVERWKELMGGATVMVEVKNKPSGECNPYIVCMNSNLPYSQQLDTLQARAMKIRLFSFDKLKRSDVFKNLPAALHPGLFFYQWPLETDDELRAIELGDMALFDSSPAGRGEIFDGDLSSLVDEGGRTDDANAKDDNGSATDTSKPGEGTDSDEPDQIERGQSPTVETPRLQRNMEHRFTTPMALADDQQGETPKRQSDSSRMVPGAPRKARRLSRLHSVYGPETERSPPRVEQRPEDARARDGERDVVEPRSTDPEIILISSGSDNASTGFDTSNSIGSSKQEEDDTTRETGFTQPGTGASRRPRRNKKAGIVFTDDGDISASQPRTSDTRIDKSFTDPKVRFINENRSRIWIRMMEDPRWAPGVLFGQQEEDAFELVAEEMFYEEASDEDRDQARLIEQIFQGNMSPPPATESPTSNHSSPYTPYMTAEDRQVERWNARRELEFKGNPYYESQPDAEDEVVVQEFKVYGPRFMFIDEQPDEMSNDEDPEMISPPTPKMVNIAKIETRYRNACYTDVDYVCL